MKRYRVELDLDGKLSIYEFDTAQEAINKLVNNINPYADRYAIACQLCDNGEYYMRDNVSYGIVSRADD